MKKFLLLAILTINFLSSHASHVSGGELTYTCQGNGTYEFTFTFYRNCFGIPAPATYTMTIDNSCGFPSTSIVLTMDPTPPQEILPPCGGGTTTCHGGTSPGIQKYFYRGFYTFPAECHWLFGVAVSSRNAALSTIVNPDSYNLYVTGSMGNFNNSCDTSPVFNQNPIILVCVNETTCIDLSTTDAEGDSLSYALMSPLSGANQPLVYDSGYSVSNPMQMSQPLTLDSLTGELCITPSAQQIAVYAVLVSAYRNDTLISQVERDIELYSVQCAGSQPTISGINGSGVFDTTVCAYSPTCFNILSNDIDPSDTTTMSWDQNIPNATLSIGGSPLDSGYFCWTPDAFDASNNPHCFTVNVHDNTCPAHQTNSKTFCITVVDTAGGACLTLSSANLNKESFEMKIYPQPARDQIHFVFPYNVSDSYLVIVNSLNQKIYQSPVQGHELNFTFDKRFTNGMYYSFLMDRNGNMVSKKKFVVLKE